MINNSNQSVPHILLRLAGLLGTHIQDHRLNIPEKFGTGYCCGYVFNEHIRMIVSNYELKDDLLLENPEVNLYGRILFFKFQHVFSKTEQKDVTGTPSVLIATSRINTDDVVAIHSNTSTINIEVDADYLKRIFGLPERASILQSLLQNDQSLLFEQIVFPSLQKIVDEILNEPVDNEFQLFFLRIKAEEMICRLLMELAQRDEQRLYPLNTRDVQIIYKVKELMLKHIDKPPVINKLSDYAGMSPTKLKRLFRQIFGNSIFNYYQDYRMRAAARMLKDEKVSVTEVGYKLGYTNLSHFSRVFKAYVGLKPKQFSKMKGGLSGLK